MVEQDIDLDHLIDDKYVPSSLERKKAILMYFLIGIFLSLQAQTVSQYEHYHLKQSLGRRSIFFVGMIIGVVLIFVPYLWIIPFFLFLCFLGIWLAFSYQARTGTYSIKGAIFLPFFSSFGSWMLSIFELHIQNPKTEEHLPDEVDI